MFTSIDEFAFHDQASTLWGWPGQNPTRYADKSGRFPFLLVGFGVAAAALLETDQPHEPSATNYAIGAAGAALAAGGPGLLSLLESSSFATSPLGRLIISALGGSVAEKAAPLLEEESPAVCSESMSAANFLKYLNQLNKTAGEPTASQTLTTFFKANENWSGGPVNITPGITPDLLDLYANVAAEAKEGTQGHRC